MRARYTVAAVLLGLVSGLHAAPLPRPPKLLVVLVVDQMRGDYVDKLQHQWTRGLRRLIDEGAWFRQADYPYFNTVTCPGHATIATGMMPATHGLILNSWWDRESAQSVTCTQDQRAADIGYGTPVKGGDSAARMLVPTLADELRAQRSPAAHVLSFSLKARSAIMLAGHHPDAVTWFDDDGVWATSTAFAQSPVPEIAEFVAHHPVSQDFSKVWERTLPAGAYLYEDRATGARPTAGMTPAFPHQLRGTSASPDSDFYDRWQSSPYADEYLARMALSVATSRGFGRDAGPNLLAIGFSTLDKVGHDYGPNSSEIQDVLVRLDRTLGELFDGLDRLVGAGEYTVALSADHGVAPIPERSTAQGFDAGRVSAPAIRKVAANALAKSLGPGDYVAQVVSNYLYLKPGAYERLEGNPPAMRDLRTALLAMPGMVRIYTRDELAAGRFAGDVIGQHAARSYVPGRSGDFMLVFKPYWIGGSSATGHGSAYSYDTRVPVFLMGQGIAHGQYMQAVSPADIAPTLAFLAGVTLPQADGRVLTEALSVR